jgi:hypothetical protein
VLSFQAEREVPNLQAELALPKHSYEFVGDLTRAHVERFVGAEKESHFAVSRSTRQEKFFQI